MRLRQIILFFTSVFCICQSFAQSTGSLAQSRILILLDRSSSMVQSWAGGKEKYKAANDLIIRLIDSLYTVNPQVEVGLRVFGHQSPAEENNCYDTKMEVLFSKDVRTQMTFRLNDIKPYGVTPIAYALEQSARHDIVDVSRNAYCIVLITDGGESCGGNVCDVVEKFIKNAVHFRPYIISLDDNPVLKTTYSCLGDYLQVTRQGDITPAVATIVEAFRPILKITADDYKQLHETGTSVPSVMKVNPPSLNITIPKGDTLPKEEKKEKIVFTKPIPNQTIPGIIDTRLQLLPVRVPSRKTLSPAAIPDYKPVTSEVAEGVAGLPLAKPVMVSAVPARLRTLRPKDPGIDYQPVTEAPPRIAESMVRLIYARQKNMNVIFVIEDRPMKARPVPPYVPVRVEETVVVAPAPVVPVPAKPKEPKKAEYKTVTEDAPETTLEIYFTNGKGKYYMSTPQVQLLDLGSNQVVKKFYRTVDENGNPDPQTHILPGRYDIAITESRGVVNKNVEIVAGKKNKIFMTVQNTSLSFAYLNAPNRPVSEFVAVVTERNRDKPQGGSIRNQKCTELIEYEPGNYHIEINTFPVDVRNVDLDFNETVITILQPGFAKFTAEGPANNVVLWRRLGDKFEAFYRLDLNDPRSKHLQIQPGEYQVHYLKARGTPEKVVQFLIKPTQETEIILK